MRLLVTLLLSIALLLLFAGIVEAQGIAVDCEVHDVGVVVKITPDKAFENKLSFLNLSWYVEGRGGRPVSTMLPASNRTETIPIELNEGELLRVRVSATYNDNGYKMLSGEGSITGPTWDVDSSVSAKVEEVGSSFVVLGVFTCSGQTPSLVRIYDRTGRLLGELRWGEKNIKLTGLDSGTRYELVMRPLFEAPDGSSRGRMTSVEPFLTSCEKNWALMNRGNRLNADSPLPDDDWRLRQVFTFNDKTGNLVFTFPTVDLGWGLGRFNATRKKWEVLSQKGWAEDRATPVKSLYGGQFVLRRMSFFESSGGDVRAVVDCSTAINNRTLDIHGNLHDFLFTGDDFVQWTGAQNFGVSASRPLFNSWGGTGIGWGFDHDGNGKGLVVHSHYTLGSNKHLIAARLDLSDKEMPWRSWSSEGWKVHNYSNEFVFGDKSDKCNYEYSRVAYLGGSKWLVVFQFSSAGNQPFWTAALYDDRQMAWQKLTDKGWSAEGDFRPVHQKAVNKHTWLLKTDGAGKVHLYAECEGQLVHSVWDEGELRFREFEQFGPIHGAKSYVQRFLVIDKPDGGHLVAYSRSGSDLTVVGVGAVFASLEEIVPLGADYISGKAVVFLKKGGDLIALRELPLTGELAPSKVEPYFQIARNELPSNAPIQHDRQWLNYATTPDGKLGPSYGPSESGRIAVTSDGMVVSPHFTVCSAVIHSSKAPDEPGVFWGGFWDYLLFPLASAVDERRGFVYLTDYVTSGGGGGILGGRFSRWEIAETKRCIFRKGGLNTPSIDEKYAPLYASGLKWAADLTIDAENGLLYVVESMANRISVYDVTGEKPVRKGEITSEDFDYPRAIDIGPDGLLYVLSARNSTITVLHPDGRVIRSWGKPGRGSGELLYPWDIACDPLTGDAYVSDPVNGRIDVFANDGSFKFSWHEFPKSEQTGPVRAGTGWPDTNSAATGLDFDAEGRLFVGVGNTIVRYIRRQ
ncbi:MAG: hypothetical protein Kow00107_07020 [Planctomycetota bacterium]